LKKRKSKAKPKLTQEQFDAIVAAFFLGYILGHVVADLLPFKVKI